VTTTAEPATPTATDPAAPASDTPLTKWLKKNLKNEDADKYAEAFAKAGYTEVADLDDEAIKSCVADSPGTAARLRRLISERAGKTPPPVPDLPPGQPIDLGAPDTPKLPDAGDFSFPTGLPLPDSADAPVDPLSLDPSKWAVLIRRMRLLCGWDMSGPQPRQALKPALMFVVPETAESFVGSKTDQAAISTSIVYDESSATYVTSGFNQVTASASYAFASASVSREAKWSTSHAAATKDLYMTGSWWFPRATVDLRSCTVLHPDYIQALKDAVAATDPQTALARVFADYGHALPLVVTVGGELYFQHVEHSVATTDTSQYEEVIKAAVSVKFGTAGGEVSAAAGSGSSTALTAKNLADRTLLQSRGGDALKIEDRGKWEQSVGDSNNWSVIRDDSLGQAHAAVDLLDLLSDDPKRTNPELARLARQVRGVAGGLIGQPSPWLPNTMYHLTTDGFLLGMLAHGTGDGTRGSLYANADTTNDPDGPDGTATVRSGCSINDDSDKQVAYASLLMPVRKAEHAIARLTGENPSILAIPEMFFYPLGSDSDGGYLGPLQDKSSSVNQTFIAPTDGFLVGSLQAIHDSVLAHLIVRLPDGTTLAGCTVHNYFGHGNSYSTGSFCIPLPSQTNVTAFLNPSDAGDAPAGQPGTDYRVGLNWIPLQNGLALGPMETRTVRPHDDHRPDAADTYTAETDGFFVGSLETRSPNNGGGMANIQVNVTPPGLDSRLLGCTSIKHHGIGGGDDNQIAHNGVTVPIRAGSTYQAAYTIQWNGDNALQANYFWVPLLQKTEGVRVPPVTTDTNSHASNATWIRINLTAAYTSRNRQPANFNQNYKRNLGSNNNHQAQQTFVQAALADALAAIRTQAPNFPQNQIRQGTSVLTQNDPGPNWRAI
jgi:hypothetical protein